MTAAARRRRAVAAALATAVAAVLALAGCTGEAATPALESGLLNVLARSCQERVGISQGDRVSIDQTGWALYSTGVTVRAGADDLHVTGGHGDADPYERQALRFAGCMQATPVDYSLALADGVPQRMELYTWYRTMLDPCLRRHGVEPPELPNAEVFYAEPFGDTDPYVYAPLRDVEAALRLQAACPAGPPSAVIRARVLTEQPATPTVDPTGSRKDVSG